jgi:hypothetical protein
VAQTNQGLHRPDELVKDLLLDRLDKSLEQNRFQAVPLPQALVNKTPRVSPKPTPNLKPPGPPASSPPQTVKNFLRQKELLKQLIGASNNSPSDQQKFGYILDAFLLDATKLNIGDKDQLLAAINSLKFSDVLKREDAKIRLQTTIKKFCDKPRELNITNPFIEGVMTALDLWTDQGNSHRKKIPEIQAKTNKENKCQSITARLTNAFASK